jgi:8-oxo-dGTP pyrophosphatase MutT (NUDIX family)
MQVNTRERPEAALARELREELGIKVVKAYIPALQYFEYAWVSKAHARLPF